jgi:hypothetical protein
VGEWRGARRRALPYESNAHSYRLTVAKLAQSKMNMPIFSDWVELPRTAFHFVSLCLLCGAIGQSHFMARRSGLGLAPL